MPNNTPRLERATPELWSKPERSLLGEIADRLFPAVSSSYSWDIDTDSPVGDIVYQFTDGKRGANPTAANVINELGSTLVGGNWLEEGPLEKHIRESIGGDDPGFISEMASVLPYSLPVVAPIVTVIEGSRPGLLDLASLSGGRLASELTKGMLPQLAGNAALIGAPRAIEFMANRDKEINKPSELSSWETFRP